MCASVFKTKVERPASILARPKSPSDPSATLRYALVQDDASLFAWARPGKGTEWIKASEKNAKAT